MWIDQPERVAGRTVPTDRVGLWWGSFLAMNALDSVANLIVGEAETAEAVLRSTWFELGSNAMTLVAIAAALAVVKSTTALLLPYLEPQPLPAAPPAPDLWSPP